MCCAGSNCWVSGASASPISFCALPALHTPVPAYPARCCVCGCPQDYTACCMACSNRIALVTAMLSCLSNAAEACSTRLAPCRSAVLRFLLYSRFGSPTALLLSAASPSPAAQQQCLPGADHPRRASGRLQHLHRGAGIKGPGPGRVHHPQHQGHLAPAAAQWHHPGARQPVRAGEMCMTDSELCHCRSSWHAAAQKHVLWPRRAAWRLSDHPCFCLHLTMSSMQHAGGTCRVTLRQARPAAMVELDCCYLSPLAACSGLKARYRRLRLLPCWCHQVQCQGNQVSPEINPQRKAELDQSTASTCICMGVATPCC